MDKLDVIAVNNPGFGSQSVLKHWINCAKRHRIGKSGFDIRLEVDSGVIVLISEIAALGREYICASSAIPASRLKNH